MTEDTVSTANLVGLISEFLNEVGIKVIESKTSDETFLPGILIEDGKILVDDEKLLYPGDLLHEAGHLAVAPAHLRQTLNGEVSISNFRPELLESAAIAWSYAACIRLQIDPKIVFHSKGYLGQSEALLFNFAMGIFPGVKQLEEMGMTLAPNNTSDSKDSVYPKMIKWCRD